MSISSSTSSSAGKKLSTSASTIWYRRRIGSASAPWRSYRSRRVSQAGRLVAADGDEEPVREEAVQLDEPILVRRRSDAVEDEEVEVVVRLDLRALPEVLGVLDGQRVEPEHLAQELEIGRGRAVEVEPEEVAVLEPSFDLGVLDDRLRVAVAVEEVARHVGIPVIRTPLCTR